MYYMVCYTYADYPLYFIIMLAFAYLINY